MKVLFNAYSLPGEKYKAWGGPQVFVNQLTTFLKSQKINFVGVKLRSDKSLAPDEMKVIDKKIGKDSFSEITMAFHIMDILHSKSIDVSGYTDKPVEALTSWMKAQKVDVVLLNGFAMLNWYMLVAAHRANLPIVLSHHGLWFKEVSEFISNPSAKAVQITKRMEQDITKFATHEIFLNEFSLAEYEKNLSKVSKNKRSIIPINYNPIYLQSVVKKKKSNVIKIGFVGRWDPIKNPQSFLEIAKEAAKQGKDWEFYAVSKINDKKVLKKYVKAFQKHIKVTDHLEPKKLKEFYAEMDLLVLPSRFDVSPTVVLEAGLSGKGTLISPNVGWKTAYEKFGMKDWIIDFKNPKLTVRRIEKLLNDPIKKSFTNYLKKSSDTKQVFKEYVKVLKKAMK